MSVETGIILPWPGSFTNIPSGYFPCDGSILSRSFYSDLLTALTVRIIGTITSNGGIISSITGFPLDWNVGSAIEGPGIPFGTIILSIDRITNTITLSQATTQSGSFTFTIFPYGNGDGVGTFNIPNLRGLAPIGVGGPVNGPDIFYLGQTGGEQKHALSVSELPPHSHGDVINWAGYITGTTYVNTEDPNLALGGNTRNVTTNTGDGLSHNNIQPYFTCYWIIKT